MAEAQSRPHTEDELKAQLVSNFWKQTALFGSNWWGLISVPFVIFSPSFWVYYDLATRARVSVWEFQDKLNNLDRALLSPLLSRHSDLGDPAKAKALDAVLKSTPDPGLLEWDRLQAEKLVHVHQQLFARIDYEIAMKEELARFIKENSSEPEVVLEPLFPKGVDNRKAVVLLGYWAYPFRQKIIGTRKLDIPSAGRTFSVV